MEVAWGLLDHMLIPSHTKGVSTSHPKARGRANTGPMHAGLRASGYVYIYIYTKNMRIRTNSITYMHSVNQTECMGSISSTLPACSLCLYIYNSSTSSSLRIETFLGVHAILVFLRVGVF